MPLRDNVVPGVRKIAVLRANGIGDFICALPALEALRAAYPCAEITLLAKSWHRAFLAGRPGPVDRVVATPVSTGVNVEPGREPDSCELDRFFASMQAERFDLALQMHGGGRNSNPFLLRLGARTTAGLKTPDAPPLDRWVPYVFFQHEVVRLIEVASLVGATPSTLDAHLSLTWEDRAEAERVVPLTDRPLVVLSPGAGDSRRWWRHEGFAAVGDALAARGAQVVVIGAEGERCQVHAVVNSMRARAVNLCGRLSLRGLAGLLARCSVVVANDSGPLHLAHAVGAPAVSIYWCINLCNWAPLTRALHRPLVSWRLNCPVCGRSATSDPCEHRASFVADVPTEEVVAAALDLFDSAPSEPRERRPLCPAPSA